MTTDEMNGERNEDGGVAAMQSPRDHLKSKHRTSETRLFLLRNSAACKKESLSRIVDFGAGGFRLGVCLR